MRQFQRSLYLRATSCPPSIFETFAKVRHCSMSATMKSFVLSLRNDTQLPMAKVMACVKACGQDRERCVAWLQENCAAVSVRPARAGADKQGLLVCVADPLQSACILEVTCDTEFGARSENFVAFAAKLAGRLKDIKITDPVEVVADIKCGAIEDAHVLHNQLKEQINVPMAYTLRAPDGEAGRHFFGKYAHTFGERMGAGLGQFVTAVHLTAAEAVPEAQHEKIVALADSVCRHMVATSGLYDTEVVMVDGIAQNFYKKPLAEQKYMGEGEPIAAWLRAQAGVDLKVTGYEVRRLGR